jgi:arylsulfatase A-like enzyme
MKALILQADALHLGYLGCYGNEWVATPTFDCLAAESVVFDQHFADSVGIAREHLSGWYEFSDSAAESAGAREPRPQLDGLLEAGGVRFVRLAPATTVARMVSGIRGALADVKSAGSSLVWAHLPTLAPPWNVPADFLANYLAPESGQAPGDDEAPVLPLLDPHVGPVDREDFGMWHRLQLTYAAAVTHLDEQLGVLVEALSKRDLLDNLLLAVTADCGLPLGEHGIVGHQRPWLHDELIHLPLIVRLPGGAEAGRRVPALTQPVDLLPTLLEAFALPTPELHGRSLWPLLRGEAEQVRTYACSAGRAGGAAELAMRTPDWAFLLPTEVPPSDPPRGPQLYVKPDDRWEVNDVRQHHLELAEHLEKVLGDFVRATRQPGPLRPPELRAVVESANP